MEAAGQFSRFCHIQVADTMIFLVGGFGDQAVAGQNLDSLRDGSLGAEKFSGKLLRGDAGILIDGGQQMDFNGIKPHIQSQNFI